MGRHDEVNSRFSNILLTRLKKIYVTRALAMFILYAHVFGML